MGRRVVPPPPPPGVLEVVISYVVTHVDMAKLAVVTEMRKMTPGDKDTCLLYTSPSPRDRQKSRMPSSA